MRVLFLLLLTGLMTIRVQAEEAHGLTSLYQLAAANNAELAAARSAWQARSENLPQARAGLLPNLGLEASNSHMRTKADTREHGQHRMGRNAHSYQASLSQPLFRLDRWYQLKAAQADNEQATLELSAAEQALILQTAERYFAVLAALDQQRTSTAEVRAFAKQMELANERFAAGLGDKTDVLQARAAHDHASAGLLQAQHQVENSRQALTALSGRSFMQLKALQHQLPVQPPVPANAADWVERALNDNLQLQALEFAVQAASHDLSRRKAAHGPSLDAIARHQRGDNDGLGLVNRGMPPTFDGRASQTLIGLQLSIPLYSGGILSSQVRQGRYLLEQSEHLQEQLRRDLEQHTRSLHHAVSSDAQQVGARRNAIVSALSALEASQLGYEAGLRTLPELLDAQQLLYNAISHYNAARYAYVLDSLRLQQAAGSLSPDSLLALDEYLYVESADEAQALVPPELEQAAAENLRRK